MNPLAHVAHRGAPRDRARPLHALLRTAAVLATVAQWACPSPARPTDAVADAPAAPDAAPDADDAAPDAAPDAVDTGPPPSGIGRACTRDPGPVATQGDCDDGQFCLDAPSGWPGGYCAALCDVVTCPADTRCARADGQARYCLHACETNRDCRVEDGYVCATLDGARVCVPAGGPLGLRDGDACYTTAPGPHQVPALERRTFATPELSASAERTDAISAAESHVAHSARAGTVVTTYIAQTFSNAFLGSSSTRDGTTVTRTGAVRDAARRISSDPVLAYGRDGTLHLAMLSLDTASTGLGTNFRIRLADSTDDGASWTAVRPATIDTQCGGGCDKPWLAAGPLPLDGGELEAFYLAYRVGNSTVPPRILIQRSLDGAQSWSDPATLAAVETVSGSAVRPQSVTVAVAPDGVVHASYFGLRATDPTGALAGATGNRIVYRVSRDGGQSWEAARSVAAGTHSPVFAQPPLALDGAAVHVAYVSGTPDGAWDIYLATSTDGGASWVRRKVNDEPDACATHFLPSIVADPLRGRVHVTWMDNRFGDGAAVYAACPSDPAQPCGRNERVGTQPFTFSTSRLPGRTHGDYAGLVLAATGELWAAWSDTRTGVPQIYFARGAP